MTAPSRQSSDQNAAAKGIALLVAAVIVGVVLLAKFGGNGRASTERPKVSSPTTMLVPTTTTEALATGTTSVPPAQLKVAVFNGTGGKVPTAAGNTKRALVAGGYAAANVSIADTAQRSTSVAYYTATAQRGDAAAVAKVIGLANTAVQPVGTAQLPSGATGANVVVLLGTDAQSNPKVAGSASSTSAPSSSSSTTTTGR